MDPVTAFKRYKAKPFYLYAVLYNGVNKDEVLEALSNYDGVKASYSSKTNKLRVSTENLGVRFVKSGEYLIYSEGNLFIDSQEAFEEYYQLA